MQTVCFCSTPKSDKTIREYVDMWLSTGWLLVNTEPAPIDAKNIRYTLVWPDQKGIAVKPAGFKKVKVIDV